MRASARKIANFVSGCSTKDIYRYLQAMGFVAKDKFGWTLTELGKANGGKMSSSDYPTPTFIVEDIAKKIIKFKKKH